VLIKPINLLTQAWLTAGTGPSEKRSQMKIRRMIILTVALLALVRSGGAQTNFFAYENVH
jgi:hypothetical protein